MKRKYKFIIGISVLIVGLFIVRESMKAIAAVNTPNIKVTLMGEKDGHKVKKLDTFVGGKINLQLEINSEALGSVYEKLDEEISDMFIEFSTLDNFEILEVKQTNNVGVFEKIDTWDKLKINLQGFKYDSTTATPKTSILITLEAKSAGQYDKEYILNLFKFKYRDLKSNDLIALNTQLGALDTTNAEDLNINVNDVKYEHGSITFNSAKSGNNLDVPSGESVPMYFNMAPGELNVEGLDSNVVRKRDLMYVIESNSLEQLSEESITTRDLLIKSLEELKKESPDTKVGLLIYDKTVDVKEVDGENSLSIDETIEVLKNQESNSDGGNLAEAMMKAQALINESENEKSVILVTSNNPYYYSLRDGSMASNFDLKENNVEFHEGQAAINAELVTEKIKEVKRDTRWFSISYGEKNNQNISDEMIKKLGGEVLESKNPTYEEFKSFTNQAVADVAVMVTLKGVIIGGQNEGTQVTIDESSKAGVSKLFFYKWNSTTKIFSLISDGINQEYYNSPIEFQVRVTKSDIDTETEQVDLLKKVKISSTYEILGIPKVSNGIDLGFGDSVMNVTPVVAYETRVGMFNGKKTGVLVDNEKGVDIDDFRKETIQYVGTGNEQTGGLTVNLALDNYFSIGILVKPNIDISIDGTEVKGENILKDTDIKAGIDNIYRLDKEEDKFVVYSGDKLVSSIKDEENIIDDEPIYLVVINGDIKTNNKSKIGNRFRVGINIEDARTKEVYENQGIESSREVVKTFVGLNGMISAKPEHY